MERSREDVAKEDSALQRALAKEAKPQIEAENKAVKAAQKEKETQAKQASKPLKGKHPTPTKVRKALVRKKKVVRFIRNDQEEGVQDIAAKHFYWSGNKTTTTLSKIDLIL